MVSSRTPFYVVCEYGINYIELVGFEDGIDFRIYSIENERVTLNCGKYTEGVPEDVKERFREFMADPFF